MSTKSSKKPVKPMLSVFMPARDEEKNVGKNLDVILQGIKEGKINHAVIVIDGSRDRTPQIVFKKLNLPEAQMRKFNARVDGRIGRNTLVLPNGVILIRHAMPEGKGRSFAESVWTLKGKTKHFKNEKSVLVNFDADALDLELKKITGLASIVHKTDEKMVLGSVKEGLVITPNSSIGFRAMRTDALRPLFDIRHPDHKKWVHVFPKEMGMDFALNKLVYPDGMPNMGEYKRVIEELVVKFEKPFRHQSALRQIGDHHTVSERLELFSRKPDAWLPERGLAFKEKHKNATSGRKRNKPK